jgi:hypothetical protein
VSASAAIMVRLAVLCVAKALVAKVRRRRERAHGGARHHHNAVPEGEASVDSFSPCGGAGSRTLTTEANSVINTRDQTLVSPCTQAGPLEDLVYGAHVSDGSDVARESGGVAQPDLARRERVIEGLVGLALDDLETGNLDIETALRLVATRAWSEGHHEGASSKGSSQPRQ